MSTNHHSGAHGQNEHKRRPRPLSIKQRRAIELLLNGLSDGEVAVELELRRETVNRWRHHHELFKATLEEEQERLWLLERAQREIEAAKRHTPAISPPPIDKQRIADALKQSPQLRIALRKQALCWLGYPEYRPTDQENELLKNHPGLIGFAAKQLKEWTKHTEQWPSLLVLILDGNSRGRQLALPGIPSFLDQPETLPEEQIKRVADEERKAVTASIRQLYADGISLDELARLYGISLESAQQIVSEDNCSENLPENLRESK